MPRPRPTLTLLAGQHKQWRPALVSRCSPLWLAVGPSQAQQLCSSTPAASTARQLALLLQQLVLVEVAAAATAAAEAALRVSSSHTRSSTHLCLQPAIAGCQHTGRPSACSRRSQQQQTVSACHHQQWQRARCPLLPRWPLAGRLQQSAVQPRSLQQRSAVCRCSWQTPPCPWPVRMTQWWAGCCLQQRLQRRLRQPPQQQLEHPVSGCCRLSQALTPCCLPLAIPQQQQQQV